ncbi:MAG: glycosyltransferase family 2 protein [Lachnospiraceae bacterium]|nr:glycosyltransferase family 2 protein [Lachnospiraceae bacterium]
MNYYRYVVVILVYRNSADLEECMQSIRQKIKSVRMIVVNAYYDDESQKEIERITKAYDGDFISVENKGYSFGNNRGIDLALDQYEFEYLIISNPDVIIQEFDADGYDYDVIAPMIRSLSGKAQNPMVIKRSRLVERLIFRGLKRKHRLVVFMGIAINKLRRECGLRARRICGKENYPIYQPHGSFVMIHKRVIHQLHPIYDENMFLFAEENVLSKKLKDHGFTAYFVASIKILHKEDGSMRLVGKSFNEDLRKSNLYYYETYGMR